VLAAVREAEHLNGPGSSGLPRIAVGGEQVFAPLIDELTVLLISAGVEVHRLDGTEPAALVAAANASGGDLYVHLAPSEDAGLGVAYYAFENFTSLRGKRLAELILRSVPTGILGPRRDIGGMRLIVLRETKMPAVHLELGSVAEALEQGPSLLRLIGAAIVEWSTTPPSRDGANLP
jgi:N-acetylmuramoyl-L-alanine amidase